MFTLYKQVLWLQFGTACSRHVAKSYIARRAAGTAETQFLKVITKLVIGLPRHFYLLYIFTTKVLSYIFTVCAVIPVSV